MLKKLNSNSQIHNLQNCNGSPVARRLVLCGFFLTASTALLA